jgi:endonuclease-3
LKNKYPNSQDILHILEDTYKGSQSALKFDSVFQLLIAVILSAQTNDNQVNKITDILFARYPDAAAMARLSQEELEEYIRTCGLYKNKAKNIFQTVKILNEQYDGRVPSDKAQLMKLPGVGRKTANVIQSVGFGLPALAVDTHVFRVAHRLRLAFGKTPDAVEKELCELIPREKWAEAHHWLIWHGRKLCKAQNPLCDQCPLLGLCPEKS